MMKYPLDNGYRHCIAAIAGFLFLVLQLLAACAGDAPNSSMIPDSQKSSANLSIRWYDEANLLTNLDCQAGGVEQVACDIYDENGQYLITAGPWPCTEGKAVVEGIPAGPDRTFVVSAEDSKGDMFYHGETSGVLIEPGVIFDSVVVDARPFRPILTAPQQRAEVDPAGFAFAWEELADADEYMIQIYEDPDFEVPLIEDFTTATTYTPADLLPAMEYSWKIQAFDRFGCPGVWSETRSFSTTDCTYTISSTGNDFGVEGGSGGFDVSSLYDDCQWVAATDSDWIRITAGTEGSGSGRVAYEVAANQSAGERSGAITAGGQIHAITQEGIECDVQISPAGRDFDETGGTGAIQVTASAENCSWEAVSSVGWITLTSGGTGTGNGTVNYTVATNTTEDDRTGVITIAGRQHTVSQRMGECTYQISPAGRNFNEEGGDGTIGVTTSRTDCPWTASSNVGWITIASGGSGSSNDIVNYTVAANNGDENRTGVITVAGQRHTVHQEAPDFVCTYDISPARREFDIGGGAGTLSVATNRADCPWSASSNVGWITITSGGSGSSDGTVNYTVAANNTADERTGVITVGGQTHTVHQGDPVVCTYEISPQSREFYEGGGTGAITVTTNRPNCPWNAASNADWIHIDSGASGNDSGTVNYTVAANDTEDERTGVITVGGQRHTVQQEAPEICNYVISPARRDFNDETGGTGTISVTTNRANCPWSASSNDDWIQIDSGGSGNGNGTVGYTVSANFTGDDRTGAVTAAGQRHVVYQIAHHYIPSYEISPQSREFAYDGGTGSISVAVEPSNDLTLWTATSNADWIQITSGASGSGDGIVNYTVAVNNTETERTGTIDLAGRTHTVRQEREEPIGQAPVISNLSYDYSGQTTQCFPYPGAEPYNGELFIITFDYLDNDGDSELDTDDDGEIGDGAHVYVPYDNTPWSTSSGDGYSGTIRTRVCFDPESSASHTYTVTLRDADQNVSNSLTVTVSVPEYY